MQRRSAALGERDEDGAHGCLLEFVPGRRVGYVTDLRYTEANLHTLDELLVGVDLVFIESVFLDSEAELAARKNHLTARQAGAIARRLGAKAVVPFHFSPRYENRGAELHAEAQAAWADGCLSPTRGARE